MKKRDKTYIELEIFKRKSFLFISCKNSVDPEKEKEAETEKTKKKDKEKPWIWTDCDERCGRKVFRNSGDDQRSGKFYSSDKSMSSGRRNISAGLKNLGVRKVTPRFFDGWNNLKTVSAAPDNGTG